MPLVSPFAIKIWKNHQHISQTSSTIISLSPTTAPPTHRLIIPTSQRKKQNSHIAHEGVGVAAWRSRIVQSHHPLVDNIGLSSARGAAPQLPHSWRTRRVARVVIVVSCLPASSSSSWVCVHVRVRNQQQQQQQLAKETTCIRHAASARVRRTTTIVVV